MVVFAILRPNLRTLSEIEMFFLKIKLTGTLFCGEIYRQLTWRWIHYIIVSGSLSKVEKTLKNSVIANFDCDAEIMIK